MNGIWMDDFENSDGGRATNLLAFANSWKADGLLGNYGAVYSIVIWMPAFAIFPIFPIQGLSK